MELSITRYEHQYKDVWNRFVKEAKNYCFLFDRDYMEYHSDRFKDHSLLFFKNDELVCVLPASEKDHTLYSHGGLTFGGFIMSHRISIIHIVEAFELLKSYLAGLGFRTLIYKAIPHIYHKFPAQEDLYGLFKVNARLYRRDAGTVIDLQNRLPYTKGTKSNLSKARKYNLRIVESTDFQTFMKIEEELLQAKYNVKPVHSVSEIILLANRFPDNIKLYLAYKDEECLGGVILYISGQVVHTQYIGITDNGKAIGALDMLTDFLLSLFAEDKKYFSFGISTEQEGLYLNEGLIRNKESFGARTVIHDFYQIDL